ncbi:WD40/YVTN repeat-like-containing domain [Plasmopara halstedii]|uniref:WD40/YVTN repeat-like-containing domain n=1 Tax=Plasmopara halstedii TaxID=4781 RepID=A0A0P1B411_PLAHL|nr:WD40/YVTN repeat-like-containing domain [Plasmopara halstedii]CEG48844.1 WD40/YVTN repeat-like-containing domain [Plasmopara halstedii]|eukprot:XP_024585213.1 WD40/YVTN repeat-like-containing domain [Plasmopara halstedii]
MDGTVDNLEKSQQNELALYASIDENTEPNLHLTPTYVLGFRSCGRTVIEFVSESRVIYPVAHHLVIYNLENRSMEFFYHVHHVKSVQCFRVSPNLELLAVAEIYQQDVENSLHKAISPVNASLLPMLASHGSDVTLRSMLGNQESHAIAIYNLGTKTRVKTIPLSVKSSVASCSFSANNKYLAVLEDAPYHNLTYWKLSEPKLVASCKCPSRGTRIYISPNNNRFISISGPAYLKYWIRSNKDTKLSNFVTKGKDQEQYVDHTWVKEHMIALAEYGLILCFRLTADVPDLIHSFRCHQPSHVRMECVTGHEKGFVLGGSAGFFGIYEALDDPKDPFSLVRSVSVGDVAFECITVSPSTETIIACLKNQSLVTVSMNAIDNGQEDRFEFREMFRHGHQVGSVVQVDVCVQRSIIATCGTDKTVRVWNFELKYYELSHHCLEEPTAIALHPSGFILVVAFKERVRVYQILHDSLSQLKELSFKACRFIRYAHGGHLFACASGLTVIVLHAYSLDIVHVLSGHVGAVRCLDWSWDDKHLFSAAHDGAIYRWDTSTGSRSEEMQHIAKQCHYAAFVVGTEPSIVVASGTDGKIREVVAREESRSFDLPTGVVITSMALTKDCQRLFVGTKAGYIEVYTWPIRNKSVAKYYAHAEGILHLRVTDDNEQLITCAEDGSVCIFYILRSGLQRQKHIGISFAKPESSSVLIERRKAGGSYTDAVLIAREDLEERRIKVLEWQQRYDKATADIEFALHRKENEWINRLHVLKEESEHLVIQERVRFEELEACHQLATRKHNEELKKVEAHHVKMMQEIENQYERKLAQEMARYDTLSETLEKTRQRCESLVEAHDSQSRDVLHAERMTAYTRAKEQNDIIKRLHEDVKYNHDKFKEVLHQEEIDNEHEVQKMRAEFVEQLESERRNTAVKQGQVSAANTKLESLRKKLQEQKALSHARDVLLTTEQAKLVRLEETLTNYEQHFEGCRAQSHDKDRTIDDLRSDNRVLTSFRSVLSHRIDGLETKQAPLQKHLRLMEGKISEIQHELADEFLSKSDNRKEMETKDSKLRTSLHEVKMLRQDLMQKNYCVGAMKREFTRLAQITNYKDLESAVKDAYKVHVMGEILQKKMSPKTFISKAAKSPQNQQSPITGTSVSDDALGFDCKQSVDESAKQLEYMSRTIQTLRTALDHAKTQTDRVRRESVVEGNTLIDECNRLRIEKKELQTEICDLKHTLYLTGGFSSFGERLTESDASKLQLSHSSPELRLTSLSHSPQLGHSSTRDHSASVENLQSGRATPSKQERLQRTPTCASSVYPNHSNRRLLPFKRVERIRQNAAHADNLLITIEKQKRDIQRLQKQIQLLLSGAADVPLINHDEDVARLIPLHSFPHPQTISHFYASKEEAMIISRAGVLRSIPQTEFDTAAGSGPQGRPPSGANAF